MLKLFKRLTPADLIAAELNKAQLECEEAAVALIRATEHQARAKSDLGFYNDRCTRLQAALDTVLNPPQK